jgi:hypothetical protein
MQISIKTPTLYVCRLVVECPAWWVLEIEWKEVNWIKLALEERNNYWALVSTEMNLWISLK